MNAARLREIVDLLLSREREQKIQQLLNELTAKLQNLVSAAQQPQHQQEFMAASLQLQNAMAALRKSFEPSQANLIREIQAEQFFTADIPALISDWIQGNPITPTIAHDKLKELVARRQEYLDQLNQLQTNLKRLGIHAIELQEGTAEVGFLIPRPIFDNRFDQLVRELGTLNRIIRAFSEVATGSAEIVEVRQISTSDPLFFLGLDLMTVVLIGGAVTWALATWKTVEEIRQIRSDAKKVPAFSKEELLDIFDTKITQTIKQAIDSKVGELMEQSAAKAERKNEQRKALEWALESILARVERGMSIEVRLLAPTKPAGNAEQATEQTAIVDQIKSILPQLSFPKVDGDPILQLPPPEPPAQQDNPKGPAPPRAKKES